MHFIHLLFAVIINVGLSAVVLADNVVYPCTTPDDENAHCISLFQCPGLIKLLATLDHKAIKYFKQSICLGCTAGDFMVCCGESHLPDPNEKIGALGTDRSPTLPSSTQKVLNIISSTTAPPKNESKQDIVLRTLIPDRRYCGLQHTDDRFYTDTATALDEYPWLVHIKFTDIYSDYKLGDRCTGVLLNNRYVLTDTICALPALKVRLGQYNVAYKVTCLENPDAHECNEGTVEVKVEKKIDLQPGVDPNYSLTLIRLSNTVDYNDFVRPICLPLKEAYRETTQGSLRFSGWGSKPTATVIEDAIKKRMVYDPTKMDECTKQSPYLHQYLTKNPNQLYCFVPKKTNKDVACDGDHGGPLMYADKRHQYFVEYVVVGVLNGGFQNCDNTSALAVKITPKIIDAILNNIEL